MARVARSPLSSSAELAKGKSLVEAVGIGKDFISKAIKENPGLGKGHGPVNHMVIVWDEADFKIE